MVDASRPKAALGDFKTTAFAQQNVADRDTHISKCHLHVTVRCIIVAHHVQGALDVDARGVGRYQHHALLRVTRCFRVGFPHGDENSAARVASA